MADGKYEYYTDVEYRMLFIYVLDEFKRASTTSFCDAF